MVGGGNSAGQAVVRFSRYAQRVTLLVRGRDLGASMSQYLIDQVTTIPNVDVRVHTQVAGLEADDRLRAVIVNSGDSTEPVQLPADALFICIGGTPHTGGAAGLGLATNTAGYLVTGGDGASAPGGSWPLPREPLPLETNLPECSPQETCAAGRSNAAQPPLARDQWPWRSSTGGWRRWAVTEPPAVASPDAAVPRSSPNSPPTSRSPPPQRHSKATASGRCRPLPVPTEGLVGSLLVDGAEVYNNTSQTLQAIGVADDIERSGRYQPLRLRLYRMDREMQQREMRTLTASPDYVVGSVHALTEGGSLLIASASGSQLGPLVSGAEHVILVIGAQKIVSDIATGLRRIYEYCYPLEDARARRAYGVPSGVNNILIINKAVTAGRVTAIIVKERLGF